MHMRPCKRRYSVEFASCPMKPPFKLLTSTDKTGLRLNVTLATTGLM